MRACWNFKRFFSLLCWYFINSGNWWVIHASKRWIVGRQNLEKIQSTVQYRVLQGFVKSGYPKWRDKSACKTWWYRDSFLDLELAVGITGMHTIVSVLHFIPAHEHSGKQYLFVAMLLFVLWHLNGCFQLKKKLITIFVPGKNTFISDIESSTAWERNHAWSAKMFWIAILHFFTSMQSSMEGVI